MNKLLSLLVLLAAPVAAALASDPASQDVAISAVDGQTTIVEWTGTALPGASGAGSAGGVADPAAAVGCQMGVDDAHEIVFTLPAGIYDNFDVLADFHIEFEPGTPIPGVASDPDLALTVYQGSTEAGSSDGGDPQENVRIVNPVAGTATAVVCPFTASQPTDYKGKLTVVVQKKASCVVAPGKALAHSTLVSKPGALSGDNEFAGLLNFDVFRNQLTEATPVAVPQINMQGRYQSPLYDRNLGLPTFLWAKKDAVPVAVGALTEKEQLIARARAQLQAEAKDLKLTPAMIREAKVINAQYNGNGPAIVRFRQQANGREVFRRTLNVMLDRSGKPLAVSGYFATDYAAASLPGFAYSAPEAISLAWKGLGGAALNLSQLLPTRQQGDWQWFRAPVLPALSSHVFEREPRVKTGYYARKGRLEPAYTVELFAVARANRNLSAYVLTISAVDGSILARDNLKANELPPPGTSSRPWTYRMYADTTYPFQLFDSPLGNGYTPFPGTDPAAPVARVANPSGPNLVTLEYGPIATKDAWLPDTATETIGNNVDACLDVFDPANGTLSTPYNTCTDPLSTAQGDFHAAPSSDHTFDYTAAPDQDPSTDEAKNGAVVSLFYLNNWLHDWWYDHGFDEASGNAQTSNYGRGGEEADPVKAQGQDGSGRNNANMATPSDGSSPTMQQYLFNGAIQGVVEVKETLNLGSIAFNGVEYGPQTFDYTGEAALADDMFEPTNDGCTGLSSPAGPALPVVGSPTVPVPVPQPDLNLAGKIAVIPRGGGCPGSYKVKWAVESGASAVVLVHNAAGGPPYLANGDIPIDAPVQPTNDVYQIPIVTIRQDDGKQIMDALAAGQAVSMHLKRLPAIDFDGTLDNQVVGHEFFHYVHHRLTDSGNQQADAMSEGWGDTDAMMISVRADDVTAPDNEKWGGAYDLAGYAINDFFAGIRRAPYSISKKYNAFTLRHIADGEPTPDGGDGSTNSEVHSAGEIWANEMWNCYAGILNTENNGSFLEKRTRMQTYIISGFKMTPTDATFTEARDAVLAPILATNFTDYEACSNGFAVTGSGLNAISPARSSTDLTGVQEDFTPFVCSKSGGGGGGTGLPTITPAAPLGSALGGGGRFGGALNLLLLLPMFGLALARRHRRA